MYYAPQIKKAGIYGADTNGASFSAYSSSSPTGILPVIKKNPSSSRCCGRGCKPCVDDLGL
ncbi:MAG: hypothetical protein Q8R18_05545 [bacterium]|nr:hypothetical protein [bacterium]